MAKQIINIGTGPNTGTGDPLRTAFQKVNENFTDVEYTHIELTERHEATGNVVTFIKSANTSVSDVIDTGLSLTRSVGGQGIYNSAVENSFNRDVSPANTEWNWSGWNNLDNVKFRHYRTFAEALRKKVGSNIVGAELVMHDITNDKYYKIKFTQWDIGGVDGPTGAFTYTRELIDTSTEVGIKFEDGTNQITANNPETWPIVWLDNNNYTIRLIDANRTLRGYDMTLYVPRDSDVNFPIGTQIGIVTESIGITLERVQHIEEEEAQIFGVGFESARSSWEIPQHTIANLRKVDVNTWYLDISNYRTDISDFTDNESLLSSSPKTWVNPNTSNTWSVIERSGGIRVTTTEAQSEDINTVVTLVPTESSFYVPRDETTQRIQDYWDGIEGGYDYTRIVIDGVEYQGFVTTYNSNGWLIQMDEPATFDVGTNVTLRYYGYPAPVKWFDAADYDNHANFLGAIVNYYALIEGRGQDIGTVWMTAMHDQYGNFETNSVSNDSGNYTDLNMDIRPGSQQPFKSLWLLTNSATPESVSVMWNAKMFYGQGAIVTPEIEED